MSVKPARSSAVELRPGVDADCSLLHRAPSGLALALWGDFRARPLPHRLPRRRGETALLPSLRPSASVSRDMAGHFQSPNILRFSCVSVLEHSPGAPSDTRIPVWACLHVPGGGTHAGRRGLLVGALRTALRMAQVPAALRGTVVSGFIFSRRKAGLMPGVTAAPPGSGHVPLCSSVALGLGRPSLAVPLRVGIPAAPASQVTVRTQARGWAPGVSHPTWHSVVLVVSFPGCYDDSVPAQRLVLLLPRGNGNIVQSCCFAQ